jgi:hypothetical protein
MIFAPFAFRNSITVSPAIPSYIQYSFVKFATNSSMTINFNSSAVNLNSGIGLTTVELSPASQTISSNVINFDDTGANIGYYINDVFIANYSGDSAVANTGEIATSAGNTYYFEGSSG